MINTIQGDLRADDCKFAIVVSRFNEFITSKLLDGAIDSLKRHGADESDCTVVWVPGSIEITPAAKKLAKSGKYDAVICIGAVIRGQTPHFDYVCQQISRGVGQIYYDSEIPVMFGVVTVDSIEQAIERAGTKAGNSGAKAAEGAIEMVNVLRQI
ncbi:6,7-dimethyl-8-ribityllumazine synthase [Sedimentisphaera salicampi]|uniref:6,7-dimethyl-8-ribityllumazine synthase n=1 Tax=Sedimentisphaera salicampi TaxID=1941349 RepID=A0A1W6LQ52_9BACT|nr:6,7-dimethyl-8-ribityllumazine synthase [Sedimentisphaera salicampi]ARN57928.1 6,7-dimethyl-8-ribityllumazine synthase [Sedimentisphaera salicampi]OXU14096.1 6,7-dimethyl-8-ribityllumazine synthase [Sedimentisphaera salicampi]